MKDFILIAPAYSFGYNVIFQLLKDKNVNVGINMNYFWGNKNIRCNWLTTLPVTVPDEKKLKLTKTYTKENYPKLDNYEAITCLSKDIPIDYPGVIAVPITFLKFYPYLDYEIIKKVSDAKINGKRLFYRILIRKR